MRSILCSIFTLFLTCAVSLNAATRRSDTISLRSPLDIPLMLSGNFGELRRNHFHSGIDFKTQGRTGFPVHAADDGYVSRASVSPWGFGRAVYIIHPSTGLTTVYGHLEAFSPQIDRIVRGRQYEEETFTIDLTFEPGEIPVNRGDVIARSGNAGSSGGPHLHFDVRDTQTENPLDPLEYFRKDIKDNVAPEVRQIALYPVNGGVVNDAESPVYRQPDASMTFTAWGDMVPGIKAYDRMSGTTNIYGVKYLTLLMDGDTIYHKTVDRFSFDDTRAVHTVINNADLIENGSWIMTTRVPQANPLAYMIKTENNGVVTINEERPYKFTWILRDEHGNTTRKNFTVNGKKKLISAKQAEGQLLLWDADNVMEHEEVYVEIPAGTLYDNAFARISRNASPGYCSAIYTIGEESIPTAGSIMISLPVENDTLENIRQYCLVKINGKKRVAQPSTYADGYVNAKVRNFGNYAVTTDTEPPRIEPLNRDKWKSSGNVRFKITDNLSGVESYRGEIDGRFALFELDGKTSTLSFKIDKERFPGNSHEVYLIVVDACGNSSEFRSKL